MTHQRNVEGLRINAQKKSCTVRKRADEAIKLLLKDGRAINFKTVAQKAGISMAYLYKNPVLRERIEHLRLQYQPKVNSQTKAAVSDSSKDAIITALREQIKQLQREIENLTRQNEVAYGLIYQHDNGGSINK